MKVPEPAIRVYLLRNRRQRRQVREGDSRRAIATTTSEGSGVDRCNAADTLQSLHVPLARCVGAGEPGIRAGNSDGIARALRVAIRPLGRTNEQVDIQAREEATEGTGKVTPLRTRHQTGIAIASELAGPATSAQDLGQGGLSSEVLTDFRFEQLRGTDIDHIEHFDDMLLFA